MKKNLNALKLIFVVLIVTLSFIACDKDYNTIGSDIIGDKNFVTSSAIFSATSYNKKLNPVQTNNLPSNLLGFHNDPVYGNTTANIVTQLLPQVYSVDFGENTLVDSVILSIPYYSKVSADSPDENGNTLYSISDSLYGDSPIKLSVYRTDYFLRNFDPQSEFNDPQYYYSDANSTINFDNHITDLLYENPLFTPSSDAIPIFEINESTGVYEEKERLAPALRVHLDADYWKEVIIDKQDDTELSNQNNFINYFRSLYFKAEAISTEGNIIMLNMASTSANITIYYSKDSVVTEGERDPGTYTMTFGGIRFNTLENNFNLTLEDGDSDLGDEKLYLKGGEGSMAVIDLFGNTDLDGNDIPDELEEFKSHKDDWLINEANLVFYEDEDMYTPEDDYHKYDRVYLYDAKNNNPVIDYFIDPTINEINPINSRVVHLGQRFNDDDGTPYRFKIRITEYINSILLKDSTNTRLGLVLSTNVNTIQNGKIKGSEDQNVTVVPSASVLTPKGTILYGSNNNVPENKRVYLEIFYTEPAN
ncbi:DUF4270 domain-containing protein [Yeosuana sp. MJ-SS3]|uniref:DUF4270 domain-containing protein n=1 Tax=Gilvirhabdus luticola TaxID=3079858 RepID=A0ABU3U345_9FLAO|nr:DUF4270 domain-containing protein [Yeosuana sp. MJ-SS3]MDU8884830.1 DUF4270 domain-containing protein [Yeosuana sp. MJ-SS3]